MDKKMRIAKWLGRAGVASRRDAERLIVASRVRCHGVIVDHPAFMVDGHEEITVDGRKVAVPGAPRLWRYYKPCGLLVTNRDPQGRPTIFETLPSELPRVVSVGRLDINSEGLLLLTNNGELARYLEQPQNGLSRKYKVRVFGVIDSRKLSSLKSGCVFEGIHYGPVVVEGFSDAQDGSCGNYWLTVTLKEGKNREVRKVMQACGLQVNRLIRLSYGPFTIKNLKRGDVVQVPARQLEAFLGGTK